MIPLQNDSLQKKTLKKAGALNEFACPELIDLEKSAWEKAEKDKYENLDVQQNRAGL